MIDADYYSILEIDKTATLDEIKKAYKKMAIKWHPDRNPNNSTEATEKFKNISKAYEILSNPESRKRYDFWQKHPLSELYVLSERPSFINGKTDATAYGWFVWRKNSTTQGIYVI